jgi:hypothetical protein
MSGQSDNFTSTNGDKDNRASCCLATCNLLNKNPMFRRIRNVFFITFVIVVVIWMSIKPEKKPSKMRVQQMRSNITLRALAEQVLTHRQTYPENVPLMLRDLNIHGKTDMFKVFNGRQDWKPEGWSTNNALVDIYSDYAICLNPDIGIIVFEKPGLWPDGSVAVCFTNLIKVRVWTSADTGTGTTETVCEKKQLLVERFPYTKFVELLKQQ